MTQENSIKKIIEDIIIEDIKTNKLGAVSSPSTNTEIVLDIVEASQTSRAIGQMVFFTQKEDDNDILSLGQIVEVTTKNRWHEDMSFKGVIKRHGHLPNLSGTADNRVAKLSVQSSFLYSDKEPPVSHILGISPSTGGAVCKMRQDMISGLVSQYGEAITYIGRVYGTDIHLPMWFQHFDKDKKSADGGRVKQKFGAGDTYHIGVFGKTGSGKTVTSAFMLLGYAKNKANMNILVLDPQSQFARDGGDLLPGDEELEAQVELAGMDYKSYKLIDDIALPEDDLDLLGNLLLNNGFVKQFGLTTPEKQKDMRDCIVDYLSGRSNNPGFSIAKENPFDLLQAMVKKFVDDRKYVERVYVRVNDQERLMRNIDRIKDNLDRYKTKWMDVLCLFSKKGKKLSIPELIEKIVSYKAEEKGSFIVLDMEQQGEDLENENMRAVFLDVIERAVATKGSNLYAEGKRANCLIVMDEAHRYVNKKSADPGIRDLTDNIIDAVRTTRKYGIGHMFITQSLESLDDEIIKQMRVFVFGHGLATGSELKHVGEIINNPAALSLYKSFIDPIINGKYPFMVSGPVSPLSATGAPLFMEVYTKFADYQEKNKKEQNS